MSMGSQARRVFPWVTPALIVVEVVLVVTGVLRPVSAVVVFVVVESTIAIFGVSAVVTAGRVYRRSAREGTRRDAAGKALESVLPRRVARAVVIDAHAWRAFALWLRRRPLADSEYSYGGSLRPLLFMVIGLLVVEGAVVELVVGVMFGHGWWLWVLAGLHIYALCWIIGIMASLRTLPHRIGSSTITLRDSIFDEFQIPASRVKGVHAALTANTGRSGLLIDPDSGSGRLCHGDGTVTLSFCDNTTIRGKQVQLLAVSVDRPAQFVAACTANLPTITRPTNER